MAVMILLIIILPKITIITKKKEPKIIDSVN